MRNVNASAVTVLSAVGEPLAARIALVGTAESEMDGVDVRLASASAYASQGLAYSPSLSGGHVSLVRGPAGPYISLTTDEPVNDLIVPVVIETRSRDGSPPQQHAYTILPYLPGSPEARAAASEEQRSVAARVAAENAESEHLAAAQVAAERSAAEKAAADKAAAERLAAERAEAERVKAEKLAAGKVLTERAAAAKAASERAAAERSSAEKAAAEKAMAQREEAHKAATQKAAAETLAASKTIEPASKALLAAIPSLTPNETNPDGAPRASAELRTYAAAASVNALAGRGETLDQAIARAVQYYPEIVAAQSRREVTSAQTGQARAEFFPSVNLSAGEGRETSRNASTRFLGSDPTLTRQEGDVSVSQLLFDGGAAFGQVRRFRARTEGAQFTVSDTAQNVGARAGQAFTEVRRLREQLVIARQNVGIHERTLRDVTDLANSGKGRRVDVVQADARRALAVSSVEQLTGQLAQAEAAYKNLTGRFPDELAPPPDFGPRLPARLEDAVAQALAEHPAVRAAEKEFEASQYDRDSAEARLAVPRVTLEAGASRNRDIDGVAGPNNDRYAVLRLRYNLFRGFGDSERVRESGARIYEALAGLDRVRVDVERDVRQAWEGLAADRVRLPVLASYARSSADVAEMYRLQFQIGQRSLLDVLNAENESFNARASFVAGREAVTADEVRLLAAMGKLLEAVGVPITDIKRVEGKQ